MALLPTPGWLVLLLLLVPATGSPLLQPAGRPCGDPTLFHAIRPSRSSLPSPDAPAPAFPRRKAILLLEEETPTSLVQASRSHTPLPTAWVAAASGPRPLSGTPGDSHDPATGLLYLTFRTLLL